MVPLSAISFSINLLQYGIIRYIPRKARGNELSREQSLSLVSPSVSPLDGNVLFPPASKILCQC